MWERGRERERETRGGWLSKRGGLININLNIKVSNVSTINYVTLSSGVFSVCVSLPVLSLSLLVIVPDFLDLPWISFPFLFYFPSSFSLHFKSPMLSILSPLFTFLPSLSPHLLSLSLYHHSPSLLTFPTFLFLPYNPPLPFYPPGSYRGPRCVDFSKLVAFRGRTIDRRRRTERRILEDGLTKLEERS